MVNEIIRISDQMTAQMPVIRIDIAVMKNMLRQVSQLKVTAEDKKQFGINGMEDVLEKHLIGYKLAL